MSAAPVDQDTIDNNLQNAKQILQLVKDLALPEKYDDGYVSVNREGLWALSEVLLKLMP
ncbi:hypothetical protein [Methylovulum psychrotolerans]|uniref:Uncharacterized protein n=1 Tax=Methylovulum psychrotolerans TaxID=1704499 RepID=A0A2S5CGG1_9GAMM|nr:hypothetical protein [Methylovulum psychrotolerans]POZ49886.1 hypothetical protein AADEFJLK_04332 [Methylovulum psychrotolerans]